MDYEELKDSLNSEAYKKAHPVEGLTFDNWHYVVHYHGRVIRIPVWEIDYEYEGSRGSGIGRETIIKRTIHAECKNIDKADIPKALEKTRYIEWIRPVNYGLKRTFIDFPGKQFAEPIIIGHFEDDRLFVWFAGLSKVLEFPGEDHTITKISVVKKALMDMQGDLLRLAAL